MDRSKFGGVGRKEPPEGDLFKKKILLLGKTPLHLPTMIHSQQTFKLTHKPAHTEGSRHASRTAGQAAALEQRLRCCLLRTCLFQLCDQT